MRWAALGAALAVAAADVAAQSPPPPVPVPAATPPPAAPVPAPTPTPTPAAAASPEPAPATLDPVQVTGGRVDETQERRQSTAAKIVIGREEIDRFGDSSLADVLKRLPGITVGGAPGRRGGGIRMRGLSGGYTQILLDGERMPPGFSLESLPPDQVERIEILRAPTAETGARAIAGTINIVTRGGYTRRVNDVRVALGQERGQGSSTASWSRNAQLGDFVVNGTLSAGLRRQRDVSYEDTEQRRLDDGSLVLERHETAETGGQNRNLNANGRIEWKPGGGGQLLVMPGLGVFRAERSGERWLEQPFGSMPVPYERAGTASDVETTLARLQLAWTQRLADGRFELRGGINRHRLESSSDRADETGGAPGRTFHNEQTVNDDNVTGSTKLTKNVFESHTLVTGAEFESNRRRDERTSLQDGVPVLTEFGNRLAARATRLAGYTQDEWAWGEHWAFHAGLRWEGIRTQGSALPGADAPANRSSVWTPLLHALWKPDPKGRDQVRVSLTRSYKSPQLQQLIARPRINTNYPVPGPNTPTDADYAGNADLRPELATGVDLAFEHYLPGSGVLSASVFHRRIRDYLRSTTELETVSWSAVPRYVTRPRNVGGAMTQGVELEAKFRASEVWPAAPRIDVRANLSAYRSRVDGVPGPDNRLDQQPPWSGNLGADYRLVSLPLTIGGNASWTPGYTTRLTDTQTASAGRKWEVDAYAAWAFSPAVSLRLTLSNLAPRVYANSSTVEGPDWTGLPVRETSRTHSPTYVNTQLRLEAKL